MLEPDKVCKYCKSSEFLEDFATTTPGPNPILAKLPNLDNAVSKPRMQLVVDIILVITLLWVVADQGSKIAKLETKLAELEYSLEN